MNRDAAEAAYTEIYVLKLSYCKLASRQNVAVACLVTHDLRGGFKQICDSYQHVRHEVDNINYKS